MVLEHLFPEDWLERKHRYAFLLAVVYSTVAIIVSRLLFGANSGIVSVVFTSILLVPYLEKLFEEEEEEELKETQFTLKRFWVDNKQSIQIYAVLFLGIYLAFTAYTFVLAYFGQPVVSIFREQLASESLRGGATFSSGMFLEILLNNWWVLLACFLLALIGGDGALFFVVWNASYWGSVFGYRAIEAAVNGGAYGAFANLAIILVITFPHVILEGGAYILAAISGGVISDDVVSKKGAMSRFIYWFLASIVLFAITHYLFKIVFLYVPLVAQLLDVAVVLLLLHLLAYVFDDTAHKEVFQYNYYLFLAALAVFIAGAIVETLVVGNSTLLGTVYWAAG